MSGRHLFAVLVFSSFVQAGEIVWSPVCEPGVGGAVTSIVINPANPRQILAGGDMLGPSISDDGGATWQDTYGLKNWECAEATWKPGSTSEVWLATMGGLYQSTDGGRNWREMRRGFPPAETYWGYTAPIQKVLFVPGENRHLLAFGGSRREWANPGADHAKYGAVWESTDGGENWALKTNIEPDASGTGPDIRSAAFAAGSNQILYVATRGRGIFKSTDGGSTWSPKNNGLPCKDTDVVALHPTAPSVLWCCLTTGHRSVYKSTDGGETWKWSGEGLGEDPKYDHFYSRICVAPVEPDVLYCANSNWQQLFRSADGGATWTNITDKRMPPAPTALGFQGNWIEIDPHDSNTVYTCNSVHIFKTTNGGSTWQEITSKPGKLPDTWQGCGYSGYVPTQAKWNPYQPKQLVLMAMDDGKIMTSDDMENWRMHGPSLGNWGGGIDVGFAADGHTLVAVFGQHGWKEELATSPDGGLTWKFLGAPGSGAFSSVYPDPRQPSDIRAIRGGRLYQTKDSGVSWSEVETGASDLMELDARPSAPDVLYLTARNGVYLGDRENRFKKLVSIESAESNRLCLDPTDPDRFWVASWHYNQFHSGIWRYDHGSWERVRQDEFAYDVAVDPADPKRVLYITNHNPGVDVSAATGVWMSENATDKQPAWKQQNKGLPMLRGNCITFNPAKNGQVVVGLNGRGFYKARIAE